jgi:hypothetical protein
VGDFLAFRRMLAPVLLQLIFWVLVLACIGGGVYIILDEKAGTSYLPSALPSALRDMMIENKIAAGLGLIIGGTIAVRLCFEVLLLGFTIKSCLSTIRRSLLAAERDRKVQPTGPTAHSAPIDPGAARMRR